MKDIEGVLTPIFEEDGTTPKTPVDAGSYQVYISGIGSYTGEAGGAGFPCAAQRL